MTTVIKVAKPGFNVLEETNPNNFMFHSSYNTFKILHSEQKVVSLTSGSNTYTIPHNAIKTPPLLAIFIKFPDGKVTSLSFVENQSYNSAENGGDGHSVNSTYWDNTNIYIYVANVVTGYSITVSWLEFEPEL